MDTGKIKTLFLVSSLKVRGAEKMMVNLANRLNRNRFSIYMASLSNDNPLADQIQPDAAQVLLIPRRMRFDLYPALQLRKLIIRNQITSILAHDIFSFSYLWAALLGVRRRPKVHVSIHNIGFRSLKDLLKNLLIARLLSGEERFVSVCNVQADYWAKTYHIPRSRFITIYNGIDTEQFSPAAKSELRERTRACLQIPDQAFLILQVASLTPEKRHEDSLMALKHLADMNLPAAFFLAFVGSGSETTVLRLKQLARDLGVQERVVFCGIQEDVRPFYAAADLFTLTSRSETFSVAALEAMSMGVPCVLTDVGGAREMIVEGDNGYLLHPQDPRSIAAGWLAAYKKREQWDRAKIRARVIECFSLSECVRQYEQLLQR